MGTSGILRKVSCGNPDVTLAMCSGDLTRHMFKSQWPALILYVIFFSRQNFYTFSDCAIGRCYLLPPQRKVAVTGVAITQTPVENIYLTLQGEGICTGPVTSAARPLLPPDKDATTKRGSK